MAAERHLESEVVYVEYSGMFGGEAAIELLEAVSEAVSWSRVWYGGGLDSRENAAAVLAAGADAVVVGNVFHEIAAEEVELCARAAADLAPDADEQTVRAWLASAVDLQDAAATRYLATTLAAADPTKLARDRAVETVRTWLALEGLRDRAAPRVEDANELRRWVEALPADDLPGADGWLPPALARAYVRAHLARAFGFEMDAGPVGHVGVLAESVATTEP